MAAVFRKIYIIEDSILVDSSESKLEDMDKCDQDDRTIFNANGNIILSRGKSYVSPVSSPRKYQENGSLQSETQNL